ncbi:MAG: hypothetical protein M1832_001933 [Thelocarpon impressellum]|nr:MAG: hypothetical protein M1832_001933 [Thelocarpon impressellum]
MLSCAYLTSSNATPARVALAEATSTVLSALQATLSLSRPAGTTVLELQRLFHQPSMVVSCFENLSKAAKLAQDDEHLLSALYENVLRLEHNTGWFRDILLEVLARVSAPWLESLAVWIGIRREAYAPEGRRNATGFVHVERRTWVDDRGVEMSEAEYDLDLSMVPTFIAHEDARLMFETGKSLRLLKAHHPDHPLAQPERASNAQAPSLDWGYSWKHVEQVEAKARRYEERLIAAVNMYARTGRAMEVQSPGDEQASSSAAAAAPSAGEDMQTRMAASAVAMASPLEHLLAPTADPLRNLILDACVPDSEALPSNSSTFAPPLSLTAPLSFSPIVSAQARLVNSACIRLLFKEHNVRSHLSIQRRFHLFGDGTFTSRLSHALFDPDMESAERQKGVARSGAAMGLKLGSRESWPPASSELRLTLTGLLAETYQPDAAGDTHGSNRLPRGGEMPGGLSFSVREMSDEEIDKCMNPDSIEALDFLRLQYKPPAPLDSIITPACLLKYDKLFKLLLRVVRMNYVVNQLFRDATDRTSSWHGIDPVAQKFRIEAHHFVSTIGGYLFEVGVGSTWRKFEDKLDEVERRIDEEDARGIIGLTEGVGRLREYHERVLDRMLFATLLRKRQEQVMKLLEDTFSVILAFARYSRGRASGTASERPDDAAELRLMHTRFRKRVAVLVSVCRGLSEKRGYGQRRRARGEAGHFGEDELSEEGGNTIAQLLLKLEMSPYYSTQM